MSVRPGVMAMLVVLIAAVGCKGRQQLANEAAIEQAKLMAAQTGNAMKVTTTDEAGNRRLTLVQPPARGSIGKEITTTPLPRASASTLPEKDSRPVLPIVAPADAP